jgi:hypothetical protein
VKKVTWAKGLDQESGKPIEYDPNKQVQRYNASVTPHRDNKVGDICPGNMGGKNWPPTAPFLPVVSHLRKRRFATGRPNTAASTSRGQASEDERRQAPAGSRAARAPLHELIEGDRRFLAAPNFPTMA